MKGLGPTEGWLHTVECQHRPAPSPGWSKTDIGENRGQHGREKEPPSPTEMPYSEAAEPPSWGS